jgi:hypothetical protein
LGRTVLSELNLIHFFDFYLALVFLASIGLRVHQYRAVVGLMRAMPGRWPKLMKLLGEHKSLFLTRETIGPAALALVLIVVQVVASRFIWPEAAKPERGLTIARLIEHLPACVVVTLLAASMVGVDIYSTFWVAEINRPEMEKYFDQAEYWLRAWRAPVVRFFTLGKVNPRAMVSMEVRKALESALRDLNSALWWICAQTGLRVAYGLAIWLTYAWTRAQLPS